MIPLDDPRLGVPAAPAGALTTPCTKTACLVAGLAHLDGWDQQVSKLTGTLLDSPSVRQYGAWPPPLVRLWGKSFYDKFTHGEDGGSTPPPSGCSTVLRLPNKTIMVGRRPLGMPVRYVSPGSERVNPSPYLAGVWMDWMETLGFGANISAEDGSSAANNHGRRY